MRECSHHAGEYRYQNIPPEPNADFLQASDGVAEENIAGSPLRIGYSCNDDGTWWSLSFWFSLLIKKISTCITQRISNINLEYEFQTLYNQRHAVDRNHETQNFHQEWHSASSAYWNLNSIQTSNRTRTYESSLNMLRKCTALANTWFRLSSTFTKSHIMSKMMYCCYIWTGDAQS